MGILVRLYVTFFILQSFTINITAAVNVQFVGRVCARVCACVCEGGRAFKHKGGHEHEPFYMGPITEYNLFVSCVVLSYRSASRSRSHHVRAVHQLSERSQNGTIATIAY